MIEMPPESSVIYAVALDRMASEHVNADRIKVVISVHVLLHMRCSFVVNFPI